MGVYSFVFGWFKTRPGSFGPYHLSPMQKEKNICRKLLKMLNMTLLERSTIFSEAYLIYRMNLKWHELNTYIRRN